MKETEYVLYEPGEYKYPAAYGFVPFLHSYLHEDAEIRPVVIVAPGGGYRFVSPSEGEIVARSFYEKGYQCFVLTYSINMMDLSPLNMQPLHDISRAVRYVRKNAAKFSLDPEKLAVCGFSAAGHLCASLAVHYMDDVEENPNYAGISNRPQAAVLSYPVITSGGFAHRDSFTALLGADASEEMLHYMSLETQVTKDTVPCFLWQTVTDELVPVENSFLMAEALKKEGIPFAMHLFTDGKHGISVATQDWADRKYASPYTMAQTFALAKAVEEDRIPLPEERKAQFLMMVSIFKGEVPAEFAEQFRSEPNPEAAVWPALADAWMRKVFEYDTL
ncbi:MAG: alpha/beta hydrolase [Lachnospiraceae bacterium]|nr:alpha/beta hydrolase [Lachnospiraceae bacterium]